MRDNFQNAKLLLIEDNPDQGFVIQSALRHCLPEVEPILATTETETLAYLNRCVQEEWDLPKLILMDLYLPDRQNAWRLLEQIKSASTLLSRIPVVMFSSSDAPNDVAEAYQRGCSSYLIKPGLLTDWFQYFQNLRIYWWETAVLPKIGVSIF